MQQTVICDEGALTLVGVDDLDTSRPLPPVILETFKTFANDLLKLGLRHLTYTNNNGKAYELFRVEAPLSGASGDHDAIKNIFDKMAHFLNKRTKPARNMGHCTSERLHRTTAGIFVALDARFILQP